MHDMNENNYVLPGPEVIKLFSCSAQLKLKFILLIDVKMPTIVINVKVPTIVINVKMPTIVINVKMPTIVINVKMPTIVINVKMPTIVINVKMPTIVINVKMPTMARIPVSSTGMYQVAYKPLYQALLSKDYEKQDICILRFCLYNYTLAYKLSLHIYQNDTIQYPLRKPCCVISLEGELQ